MTLKWIRLPERRLLLNFSNWGTWHLNLAWDSEITSLVLKDAEPGQALHLNRLSTLRIWLFILVHRYGFLGLIADLLHFKCLTFVFFTKYADIVAPKLLLFFPFYTAENSQQRRLEVLYLITEKLGSLKNSILCYSRETCKKGNIFLFSLTWTWSFIYLKPTISWKKTHPNYPKPLPCLNPCTRGFFFLRCAFLPPEIKAIDRLINKYQTLSPNLHIEEPDPFYGERG